jgi:hypothetical protein
MLGLLTYAYRVLLKKNDPVLIAYNCLKYISNHRIQCLCVSSPVRMGCSWWKCHDTAGIKMAWLSYFRKTLYFNGREHVHFNRTGHVLLSTTFILFSFISKTPPNITSLLCYMLITHPIVQTRVQATLKWYRVRVILWPEAGTSPWMVTLSSSKKSCKIFWHNMGTALPFIVMNIG